MIKASGLHPLRDPSFVVTVEDAGAGRVRVHVAGTEADGASLQRVAELNTSEHTQVRDFHDQLAHTFGSLSVRASRPIEPQHGGPVPICLIDVNLDERIRYGYGDPCIIRAPDEDGVELFHLIVTSNDAPDKFPILTSPDLEHWRLGGFAFEPSGSPAWAAEGENISDYWAPEIHRVGKGYLLCFAARQIDGSLSLGLARAERANGPFVAQPSPVVSGNVIDPHIFVDGDTTYLFWKVDNNDRWPIELLRLLDQEPKLIAHVFPSARDRRIVLLARAMRSWAEGLPAMERFFLLQPMIAAVTSRYAAVRAALRALSEDTGPAKGGALHDIIGLMDTPVMAQRLDPVSLALLGEPRIVLKNDQPWEAHLIEGVWITKNKDRYYACYSGNDFSTAEYGIGVAVADSPLGPFRKMDQPLIRSTESWIGPGHPSVVQDGNGQPIMVLHGFRKAETGYKAFRALLALPIDFTPSGMIARHTAVL